MKRYFFRNKGLLAAAVSAALFLALTQTAVAFVLQIIIDAVTERDWTKLKYGVLWAVVCILAEWVASFLLPYAKSRLLKVIRQEIKQDIFHSLVEKDVVSFQSTNSADYISMFNNDLVMSEEKYFGNWIVLTYFAFYFILSLTGITALQPVIALISLGISFLPLIVPIIFGKKLSARREAYSDGLKIFNGRVKDYLSGFEVIKSFGAEAMMERHFSGDSLGVEDRKYRYEFTEAASNSYTTLTGASVWMAISLVSAAFVISGHITLGVMMAITQLANGVENPIQSFTKGYTSIKSTKAVNERILKIVDEKHAERKALPAAVFTDKLSLRDLSYSFDGTRKVLDGVSLDFAKNKKYAIVGNSGSGKSTLLRLILRYYDNYEGSVRIDGTDSREISVDSLYAMCSIIHQNVFLFDDTLKNNITLYNDYPEEQVKQAAHNAGLDSVIAVLPGGLEAKVDESGNNFSGGEKQRVAIARALIRRTPVLILDEATSSLDNQTAYSIESSLLNLPELTCLVVTHRYNRELLRRYDGIIALKSGKAAETGTFDELMAQKGYFYSLYTVAN